MMAPVFAVQAKSFSLFRAGEGISIESELNKDVGQTGKGRLDL